MGRIEKPESRRLGRRCVGKGMATLSSSPLADITSSINTSSSSPMSSQQAHTESLVSSPPTSPPSSQGDTTSCPSLPKQVKEHTQTYFSLGVKDKKTCTECGMSYMKHIPADVKLHKKHHKVQLQGRVWNEDWGTVICSFNLNSEQIVQVKSEVARARAATLELMEVVNTELNAPDDNEFWMDGTEKGVVYVYVSNGKAVGVVSVEKVKEGRWFSLKDGRIVSSQPVPLMAGISRIYVSKEFRRHGIALKLLTSVQKNLIYGMDIPKDQIGWSQPSFAGSKLATKFNGLRHKSGKILAPVYT